MESQKPAPTSDEVDLGLIFAKIGDFFKSLGTGIIRFLALIRNIPIENKILFVLLSVAGALVAISYSTLLKKKFYESSMILSSDYLNRRIVDNSIENLNLLADEKTPVGLAKALHISADLAENIKNFKARPFVSEQEVVEVAILKEQLKNTQADKNKGVVDQVLKRIEIENVHGFEFTVTTYNPTTIRPLQDALVNYFRNNDYIRRRMEISKTNLEARKVKLIGESKKMDSLKKVIYANYRSMAEQTRQGSNNVILSDKSVTNPLDVYAQDLSINDQILAIDRQLYLRPDFEIVDGFTEFNEPASAGGARIAVTGVLIGFLFGYVVVALRRFDKYLSEVK